VIARWTKVRIALAGLALVVLAGVVVRRAVQLQVHESARLREWAERNYLRDIEVAPRRGRILDRNGDELASTVDFDSIYCNPRQLAAVPGAAERLGAALGMDPHEVQRILGQPRYFAWLRRKATPEQRDAALALKLPGLGVRKEPGRVYPKGGLAATLLGYTSVDGRGLEGLELGFDQVLRGSGVQVPSIRDSYGRALLVEGLVDTSAVAGQDLVLSLDKYLTYVTESALAEAVEKHHARAGVAVVMDPRTGEVLALANVPTYDPNDPRDANAREARDRAVTDQFEPGSVMKTFTFAAVLDAGKLRPEEPFDCQMGAMAIGKYVIHDDHKFGQLTAADVFKHSSNIGTVKIARRIDKNALYQALVRFGFGRRPGIGLPGESGGTLHPARRWGEIEFATHAFGHGLTVTPLQLVTGFAAVASGGVYHPPKLALRTIQPDGREEPALASAEARQPERIISERAAQTLLKMMERVTDQDATGKLALIDGYPVAGKTGTALKVVNGRYDYQKYVASFVGIVPANDPRLVIAVVVDEPQPVHYGGQVSAPVFKTIAEAGLRYLGIPPSTPLAARREVARPPAGEAEAAVEEELREGAGGDLPPTLIVVEGEGAGNGEVEAEVVSVPSFAGMSIAQAIRAARQAGVELVPEGSGVAVAQVPAPGGHPRGSVCRVSFRPGS
jgi:cell division protein FtsI (penicillin-binding protein 3)